MGIGPQKILFFYVSNLVSSDPFLDFSFRMPPESGNRFEKNTLLVFGGEDIFSLWWKESRNASPALGASEVEETSFLTSVPTRSARGPGRGEDSLTYYWGLRRRYLRSRELQGYQFFQLKATYRVVEKYILFFRGPDFWSLVYFDMCKGHVKTLATGENRKRDLGKCTEGVFGNGLEFVILCDTLFYVQVVSTNVCTHVFCICIHIYIYTLLGTNYGLALMISFLQSGIC